MDLNNVNNIKFESPVQSNFKYTENVQLMQRLPLPLNISNPISVPPAPAPAPKVTCLQVKLAKYATSLDPRGFIPVYEYTINSQPILWDRETGYVYWTGVWKAVGREKGEIAKLVDADPAMANVIKKIRGGFLKIQGTWIPFENARSLAILTCWPIREELAVIFGPTFIDEAVDPSDSRYLRPPVPSGEPKIRNSDNIKKAKAIGPKKPRKNHSASIALLQPGPLKISPGPIRSRSQWHTTKNLDISSRMKMKPSKIPSFSSVPGTSYEHDKSWKHQNQPIHLPPLKLATNDYFSRPIYHSSNQLPGMDSFIKGSNDSSSPLHTTPVSTDASFGQITCSEDFFVDPKRLDEAINASLLLQRLSQDDGTAISRKTTFKAPTSFSIGGSEFRLVEHKYQPVDLK